MTTLLTMSNDKTIIRILKEGKDAYMKDDFYDMAIRITIGEDGRERLYRKFTFDPKEVELERGNETATQVQLGGEFITKEEYDRYGLV